MHKARAQVLLESPELNTTSLSTENNNISKDQAQHY